MVRKHKQQQHVWFKLGKICLGIIVLLLGNTLFSGSIVLAEETDTEDFTLIFQVRDGEDDYELISTQVYNELTREAFEILANGKAEDETSNYGAYSSTRNDNQYLYSFEGIEEVVLPVENTYYLTFQVKNERGDYDIIESTIYENITEEEMVIIGTELADSKTESYGPYELVVEGSNWVFYFEGLNPSLPLTPVEPSELSEPVEPEIPEYSPDSSEPTEPKEPAQPETPLESEEAITPVVPEITIVPSEPNDIVIPEVPEINILPIGLNTLNIPEISFDQPEPTNSELEFSAYLTDASQASNYVASLSPNSITKGEKLPVTSTPVWSLGLVGFISLTSGLGVEVLRRKKKE